MVIEYIGTIIRNEVANRKEKLYESQVWVVFGHCSLPLPLANVHTGKQMLLVSVMNSGPLTPVSCRAINAVAKNTTRGACSVSYQRIRVLKRLINLTASSGLRASSSRDVRTSVLNLEHLPQQIRGS